MFEAKILNYLTSGRNKEFYFKKIERLGTIANMWANPWADIKEKVSIIYHTHCKNVKRIKISWNL